MSTAPLCRWCGKPIAKYTRWIWFEKEPTQHRTTARGYVFYGDAGRPRTKAEAQRYVNEQIVSIRRETKWNDETQKWDDLGISHVGVWDGETYKDRFFCNGEHARWFGELMAEGGHCTKAYNKARAAQQQIEEQGL